MRIARHISVLRVIRRLITLTCFLSRPLVAQETIYVWLEVEKQHDTDSVFVWLNTSPFSDIRAAMFELVRDTSKVLEYVGLEAVQRSAAAVTLRERRRASSTRALFLAKKGEVQFASPGGRLVKFKFLSSSLEVYGSFAFAPLKVTMVDQDYARKTVVLGPIITDTGTFSRRKVNLSVFPNPFRDRVSVHFDLDKPANVVVEIFDILGRRVLFLEKGGQLPGAGFLSLDLNGMSPGTYFARMVKFFSDGTREVSLQKIAKIK